MFEQGVTCSKTMFFLPLHLRSIIDASKISIRDAADAEVLRKLIVKL